MVITSLHHGSLADHNEGKEELECHQNERCIKRRKGQEVLGNDERESER